MDGDALAPHGHFEADLVLDTVGDPPFAAKAPQLLDVEVGQDRGRHASRLSPQLTSRLRFGAL